MLYSGWNLVLRPYPSSSDCGSPITVVFSSPVAVPEALVRTETTASEIAILTRVAEMREEWNPRRIDGSFEPFDERAARRRAESELRKTTTRTLNAGDIARAEREESTRQACVDGLGSVGFASRALAPIGAVVLGSFVAWFVLAGGRSQREG